MPGIPTKFKTKNLKRASSSFAPIPIAPINPTTAFSLSPGSTESYFLEPCLQPVNENDNCDFDFELCPSCRGKVKTPFSVRLDNTFKDFKRIEKRYLARQVQREEFMDVRDQFCKLHKAELDIIPNGSAFTLTVGKAKGYNDNIDFMKIKSRILKLRHLLLKILDPNCHSNFRNFVYINDNI